MCIETVCRVVEISQGDDGVAIVDVEGTSRRVSLALLLLEGTAVRVGDVLLTHTGLAVRVIDDTEARRLLHERAAMRAAMEEGA